MEQLQHLTGVYGLPGGRIDKGETLENAAAREFQEETGLIPDKSSMIKLGTIFEAEIPRKSGEILRTSWNVSVIKNYSGELHGTDETVPEWVELESISELNLLPNTEEAAREGLKIINS